MKWLHVRSDLPKPRLYLIRWDARRSDGERSEPDSLLFGIELSTDYGEPVLEVEIEVPWRRPRPWPRDGMTVWPEKKLVRP